MASSASGTPPADDLFGGGAPQARPPGDGRRRTRPPDPAQPLVERLRPRHLDEVIGQPHLIGPDGALSGMLARHALPSLILWGAPGGGKTTIARLLAEAAEAMLDDLGAWRLVYRHRPITIPS